MNLTDTFNDEADPPHFHHPDHKLWPQMREQLMTVYDPEIPVNIYELGLIYDVRITDHTDGAYVDVDMSLTAPGCPAAGELPGWVENALYMVDGVKQVNVNVVFDPTWNQDLMSETAKVALNWY